LVLGGVFFPRATPLRSSSGFAIPLSGFSYLLTEKAV
jgi:hypothetical protein